MYFVDDLPQHATNKNFNTLNRDTFAYKIINNDISSIWRIRRAALAISASTLYTEVYMFIGSIKVTTYDLSRGQSIRVESQYRKLYQVNPRANI